METAQQEQFLPYRGDGAAFKFGSHKHVGLERMQDYVAAESVAVVGILEAGHYLVYPLAEHFRLAVYHHRFPARIFDAGFDALYDAA